MTLSEEYYECKNKIIYLQSLLDLIGKSDVYIKSNNSEIALKLPDYLQNFLTLKIKELISINQHSLNRLLDEP